MNEQILEVEFAENPEPRCACVLLLDVSGSMNTENKIGLLNEGLRIFQQDVVKDELASKRVEVAIVTFGGAVQVVQDFITVDRFKSPTLTASGDTPMGAAIRQALDMVEERKTVYKDHHIAYYRPWIFMITDGEPTDGDQWRVAAQRVQQDERENRVAFFVVGVEDANMGILRQIAVPDRYPVKLKGLNFREMFVWLSRSTQALAHSQIGEQTALPPLGWRQA